MLKTVSDKRDISDDTCLKIQLKYVPSYKVVDLASNPTWNINVLLSCSLFYYYYLSLEIKYSFVVNRILILFVGHTDKKTLKTLKSFFISQIFTKLKLIYNAYYYDLKKIFQRRK